MTMTAPSLRRTSNTLLCATAENKTKRVEFAARLRAAVWFARQGWGFARLCRCSPTAAAQPPRWQGSASCQGVGHGLRPPGACRCAGGRLVVWQCCLSSPEAKMDVKCESGEFSYRLASRFGLEEAVGSLCVTGSGVSSGGGPSVNPRQVLAEACRKQAGPEGNFGGAGAQAAVSASRSPS